MDPALNPRTRSIMLTTATRTVGFALVLAAITPVVFTARLDAGEIPQPRVNRFGDQYTRLDIQLSGALPGGQALMVHLGAHSDGSVRQAWGRLPDQRRAQDQLDARGLKFADGRLQGVLVVRTLLGVGEYGLVGEYRLDARVSGQTVSGSYEGWPAPRTGSRPQDDIDFGTDEQIVMPERVRWRHGEKTSVRGELTGTARDAQMAARGQSFAAGRDWPQFGGPNGDFSAAPFDGKLVDDLHEARLVWMSEPTPAGRSQVNRYRLGNIRHFLNYGLQGGTASPMIADGRVYLNFVVANSDDVADIQNQTIRNWYLDAGLRTMPRMWVSPGTDVLLCLDAATGRTLWRAEIPDGLYYPHWADRGHHKGWWGPQLAVAGGRVFFITSRNITYALDAVTGKMQWARPTPSATLRTVIDGVLLPSGGDLVGYDAASGEQLWRIGGVGTDARAPLRWTHGGKTHVITANSRGTIVCADPRTGKELWRITDSGDNSASLYLVGDYLLANMTPGRQPGEAARPYRVGAYRLSPDGPEKLWELDAHAYDARNRPLMARDGLLYFRPDYETALVVRLADGKVMARQPFPKARSFTLRMNDRLILQQDATHERTELFMYRLDSDGLVRLGDIWPTDHSTTSGYWPVPMTHAAADGRIIIRGTRGIFCYDLRKQD
jgi:outer membrane protein assembly factor BamB